MNATNRMGCFVGESPEQKNEAQEVLAKEYPGIIYNHEDDTYTYRGYKFDYFLSGISFDRTIPNGYLLVDPEDSQNWLFSFGDREERWKQHIEKRAHSNKKVENKEKKSFWSRLYNFLK